MKSVVSCFIRKQGKILILKRSKDVKTYEGKWATVSGYVEGVLEEIGLKNVEMVRKSEPIYVNDMGEWGG